MKNQENTCPKCGSENIQRVETYWFDDTEIIVSSHCDNCAHDFEQHYHAIYRLTTDGD